MKKQWNIVLKKILKRISKRQICSDYNISYWYLMRYITGSSPRTDTMDQKKILTMLLDMQDDNFELIQEISKKSKKSYNVLALVISKYFVIITPYNFIT